MYSGIRIPQTSQLSAETGSKMESNPEFTQLERLQNGKCHDNHSWYSLVLQHKIHFTYPLDYGQGGTEGNCLIEIFPHLATRSCQSIKHIVSLWLGNLTNPYSADFIETSSPGTLIFPPKMKVLPHAHVPTIVAAFKISVVYSR